MLCISVLPNTKQHVVYETQHYCIPSLKKQHDNMVNGLWYRFIHAQVLPLLRPPNRRVGMIGHMFLAGSIEEGYTVTPGFMQNMLCRFKDQKLIHRRYAFAIILQVSLNNHAFTLYGVFLLYLLFGFAACLLTDLADKCITYL